VPVIVFASSDQKRAADGVHELDAPPWQRVDSTLMETARRIRSAYDRRLSDLGLSLPEASLLAYVSEIEPQTQTELARRLGAGRAITGERIDKLVARGAVLRQPQRNDRRVWLVHITEDGTHLVRAINQLDRALREQLRANLSRAERQQLAAILLRIQTNLRAVEAMPAPSVDG
jgi:MarR family transcriptional regulator for hemolysin